MIGRRERARLAAEKELARRIEQERYEAELAKSIRRRSVLRIVWLSVYIIAVVALVFGLIFAPDFVMAVVVWFMIVVVHIAGLVALFLIGKMIWEAWS